jgi:hypothetical protein
MPALSAFYWWDGCFVCLFWVLGIELWAFTLRHSISPFLWWVFWDRVLWTICPGWLRTMILLISASQVARITGVSHQHLARVSTICSETWMHWSSATASRNSCGNPQTFEMRSWTVLWWAGAQHRAVGKVSRGRALAGEFSVCATC